MLDKSVKEKILGHSKPIYIYNPTGIIDITLLKTVEKAGAISLVNLERLTENESKNHVKNNYIPFGVLDLLLLNNLTLF
ncbi:MAG: hypothetical protein ACTSSK_08855 [Candidatus Heimdallarchaeota archaeon]